MGRVAYITKSPFAERNMRDKPPFLNLLFHKAAGEGNDAGDLP